MERTIEARACVCARARARAGAFSATYARSWWEADAHLV